MAPPFPIRISQITRLTHRQTPLLLGEPTNAKIRLSLKLPPGSKVLSRLDPVEIKDRDRKVVVQDRQEGQTLVLERTIEIPAGRVEPTGYSDLQTFARRADEATMRDIVISSGD